MDKGKEEKRLELLGCGEPLELGKHSHTSRGSLKAPPFRQISFASNTHSGESDAWRQETRPSEATFCGPPVLFGRPEPALSHNLLLCDE